MTESTDRAEVTKLAVDSAGPTSEQGSAARRPSSWRALPMGIRVGLALSAMALVLPFIGSRWAASEARRTVKSEVLDGQSSAVSALLGRLDLAYETAVRGVTSAAERPGLTRAVAAGDAEGAVAVLRNVREPGFYRRLAVYDTTGTLLASDTPGAAAFLSDAAPDRPVVSSPLATPEGVVVTVRAAFRSDGAEAGQLLAEIGFSELVEAPDGLRLPGGVDITIVDADATILASALSPSSDGQQILAPEALALIHARRNGFDEYFAPRLGYDVISTFVVAEDRAWSALAVSKREDVLAASTRLDDRLLLGGILLAGLSLVTAALVGAYVGASERRLRRARVEVTAQNVRLADAVSQLDVEVRARRQMTATATDAFVSMDDAGLVTEWNRRAEEMFGWAADEAIGARLDELMIPEEQREAHRQGLRRFLAGGDGPILDGTLEVAARHRDGTEFPVELSIWATPSVGSWTFNAFLRDISDRVALDTLRARFEAIFECSGDAITLVDPSGAIIAWNPAAEAIYGYTADEMMGRNAAAILAAPGQEQERSAAINRLAHAQAEVRCVRKDGTPIVVSVTRAPIVNSAGTLVAVSSISRDITAYKRNQEALADSNVMLIDAIARARLAAADQRTALLERVIASEDMERTQVARDLHDSTVQEVAALANDAEALRRALAAGRVGPDGLAARLDELAHAARAAVDSARATLFDYAAPDTSDGLQSAIATLAQRSFDGATTAVSVLGDLPPLDQHHATQAHRIVAEALRNTRKHAGASAVAIRLGVEDDHAVITITDDGVGVDRPRSEAGHLGVRTMHERAIILGGTCTIQSRPEGGTKVLLRFPIVAPPAP